MTLEAKQDKQNVDHYPDKNASKIQNAITVLSDMETKLSDISSQVSDMKRRLASFADAESEKAKSEIIDTANRESQDALQQIKQSTQKEADAIVAKGISETNELKTRIASKVSDAVEIIVNAVQSV